MNVKTKFLHGNITKGVYLIRPECFVYSKDARIDASFGYPVMDWIWHDGVGIFVVMKLPKEFVFIRNNEDAWIFKKVSGSWMIFLKPYVHDILLIRNDINFLTRIRTSLKIVFSWSTWANIALVLSTMIYVDSKCLIMPKPTLHIDMILK